MTAIRSSVRLLAAIAFAAAIGAGPALVADQGKSGDSTDWGCGGHPTTAASVSGTTPDRKVFHAEQAWHNWWYLNRPTLLAELSYRAAGPPPADANPPAPEKWRDEVRAALRDAIDDPTVSIASEAALGLGRGADPHDAEFLSKFAADTHRQANVRRRAALGVGLLPVDPATSKSVRDAMNSVLRESIGNNDDRLELWADAAYAMGLRGDKSAVPLLADFLQRHRNTHDADHSGGVHREVMGAATGALGLLGDAVVTPDLVDALEDHSGDGNLKERRTLVAAFAAYALARLGDRTALPALRGAAGDERVGVRRAALLALGPLAEPNDPDTVGLLVATLASEKDDITRCMAAISLGRSGATAAPAALRAAYGTGAPTVRAYVALALGLFSRRSADRDVNAFLLAELTSNHDTYETGALSIANGLARNLPAVRRLTEIASTEGENEMRSHAAFALGLLWTEGAQPNVLLDLARDGAPIVRHEAGLALGLARRRDGVDALIQVVQKGKGLPERGSAAVVLGRIAGPEAAPVLLKILRDEHELNSLRTCAAHGLGLLLDRTEGSKLGRIGADVNWVNEISHRWMPTEVIDQMLLIMD
jgi:HEAT repeat protein